MKNDVLIIGGGIVGIYCAIQIAHKWPGRSIRIIDRNPEHHEGASSHNMGGFATCEVQPLARLKNLLRAPLMMLNPLAPLTIRPSKIHHFSDWTLGFVRAALRPGHFQKVVQAQSQLMERAYQAHIDVIGGSKLEDLINHNGTICVYRKHRTLQRDWQGRWRLFRERGEDCRILDRDELRARLPSLDQGFHHAVYVPSIRFWRETATLLYGLHEMARAAGIIIERGDVTSIRYRDERPVSVRTKDNVTHEFSHLVVAAGAWSGVLCKQLGDRVPVNTERGYSTTLATETDIRNLILFPDDDFVATPMNSGLRLGGTVELAGLEAAPNYRRTDLLARQLQHYFPSIPNHDRSEWMGHRPSLPDGLPVIGQSPSHENVLYAFGHGHVGMTQAAITGRLIAELVTGQVPVIDLEPFSAGRFSR